MISKMMDWNLDEASYKVVGEFYPEDSAILFDMKKQKLSVAIVEKRNRNRSNPIQQKS